MGCVDTEMESFTTITTWFSKTEIQKLTDEIQKLTAKNDQLQQDKKTLWVEKCQFKLEVAQLRRENRELTELLQAKQPARQECDKDPSIKRMKRDLQMQDVQLAQIQDAYAKLKCTVDKQTSEMGALQSTVDKQTSEMGALQFEIWLQGDTITDLKERLCVAKELVQDLNVEMARVAAVVSESKNQDELMLQKENEFNTVVTKKAREMKSLMTNLNISSEPFWSKVRGKKMALVEYLIHQEIHALQKLQAPQTPDQMDMIIMEALKIAQAPPPAQQVAACVAPAEPLTPSRRSRRFQIDDVPPT